MIFDGLVTVYSTCRKCNTLMQVINANASETTHLTCDQFKVPVKIYYPNGEVELR